MKQTEDGSYVVLVLNQDEQWVVMATLDPDQKQKAINIAEGWLLLIPQGQVAVAQIFSYDIKYPYTGNEL